jgi:hypothetical protein
LLKLTQKAEKFRALLASGRASQAIEMLQQLDLDEAAEMFMALLPLREVPDIYHYR